MCGVTELAVAGFALSAVSTIAGGIATNAQVEQEYENAKAEKAVQDQISGQNLRAAHDKAAREQSKIQESSIREQLQIEQNALQDVGTAQAQAAATGAAGWSVDNLVADMYRKEQTALDVSEGNQSTQLTNLSNEVANAEYDHRAALVSNVPVKGAGASGVAMALDIGSAAVGAGQFYYANK